MAPVQENMVDKTQVLPQPLIQIPRHGFPNQHLHPQMLQLFCIRLVREEIGPHKLHPAAEPKSRGRQPRSRRMLALFEADLPRSSRLSKRPRRRLQGYIWIGYDDVVKFTCLLYFVENWILRTRFVLLPTSQPSSCNSYSPE